MNGPSYFSKVSVQGVVTLGGHFATLCQEVDFQEAINFQKERTNTFTLILGYFSGFSGFYLAWIFVYTWLFPGVEEVP